MTHYNADLASIVTSLSIGAAASEIFEFITGRGFFIILLVVGLYGAVYNAMFRKAVARDERSRQYGFLEFGHKLFWERLRRFEPFTIVYVFVVIAFFVLPFTAISHSTKRPVLKAMKAAHNGEWTDHSGPARTMLLRHIPLGTAETDARAILAAEGFGCAKPSAWQAVLDCQLLAEGPSGYTRWKIDLQFDSTDRLIDAKVAIWNIFL